MNHACPARSLGLLFHATAIVALVGGTALGQEGPGTEPAMRSGYGGAVHAYFSGDYQRTYDDLSLLIDAGSVDPRVWFFRGLAATRLGRSDEAAADYAAAAIREARRLGDWDVSHALERVQGADRLVIERERRRARVEVLAARGGEAALPFAESRDADADFLRPRVPEDVGTAPVEKFTEGAGEQAQPLPTPPAEEPAAPGGAAVGGDPADAGTGAGAVEEAMPEKPSAEETVVEPAPAGEVADGAEEAPMTDDAGGKTDEPAEKPDGELPAEREPPAADAPGDAVFGQ